jgi:hypothetical protein
VEGNFELAESFPRYFQTRVKLDDGTVQSYIIATGETHSMWLRQHLVLWKLSLDIFRMHNGAVSHRPAPQLLSTAQGIVCFVLSAARPQPSRDVLEHKCSNNRLDSISTDKKVAGGRCAALEEQLDWLAGREGLFV